MYSFSRSDKDGWLDLAVEISNLTKRYGSLVAVDDLDLEVKFQTIHGFLGPNGAGKTKTFIDPLSGFNNPIRILIVVVFPAPLGPKKP